MSARWIINKEQTFAIDLGKKDIYGVEPSSFEVYIRRPDNKQDKIDALYEALLDLDDPITTKLSEDANEGDSSLKVEDASKFESGMVVKIDHGKGAIDICYITNVDKDNNVLYIRKELKHKHEKDEDVVQSGHTGVYGTVYTPTLVGDYYILIRNTSIGIDYKIKKIRVEEHDIDSVYEKISASENNIIKLLTDIQDKLEESQIDGDIIA